MEEDTTAYVARGFKLVRAMCRPQSIRSRGVWGYDPGRHHRWACLWLASDPAGSRFHGGVIVAGSWDNGYYSWFWHGALHNSPAKRATA